MARDEDAEKRIRELEQPLIDRADQSQIDTAGERPPTWLRPVPMPRPTTSTSEAPQPRRAALPVMLGIGAAVIAGGVAMLALVGIVANRASVQDAHPNSWSPSSTIDPGSDKPTIAEAEPPPIVIPRTGEVAPPVDTATVTDPVRITGMQTHRSVYCNQGTVLISGSSNRVTITGQCLAVAISGVGNTITIEATASIVVSGMSNNITYFSGSPEIVESGTENTVAHG